VLVYLTFLCAVPRPTPVQAGFGRAALATSSTHGRSPRSPPATATGSQDTGRVASVPLTRESSGWFDRRPAFRALALGG
jgi:hypothetical protein